jgi:hypothetical protein
MTRLRSYMGYHAESQRVGDIDPAHGMLEYLCNRFELNIEQRYWLAFVYALTYSGPSTFYVYNEFPDFENLDEGRLERWWIDRGRQEIICQTDRRWVRSLNLFVPAVVSYRQWMTEMTQEAHFDSCIGALKTPEDRYDRLYHLAKDALHSFGQFALFLYLEALHTITPLELEPTTLNLNTATSCRNGLCYAYGMDKYLTEAGKPTPTGAHKDIAWAWWDLRRRLTSLPQRSTLWATETMLCAYKKYHRGKRYIGYYLDRQAVEIAKMEQSCPRGVAWEVLWQFRDETYLKEFRAETQDCVTHRGIKKRWRDDRTQYTGTIAGEVGTLGLILGDGDETITTEGV